jgi:ubiquinol-cytochrome c reductase core subunit 2
MLSRSSLSRNAPRAFSAAGRRSMASAANPAFQYDVTEASGVKVANRPLDGPTGTLALVAKAGSRYQPFPGFSDALERFAFKVGTLASIDSSLSGFDDTNRSMPR